MVGFMERFFPGRPGSFDSSLLDHSVAQLPARGNLLTYVDTQHDRCRGKITMHSGTRWSWLLAMVLLLVILSGPSAEARMNVVFILVDDWGYADAGIQGSDFFENAQY